MKNVAIIIPCYNEQDNIPLFMNNSKTYRFAVEAKNQLVAQVLRGKNTEQKNLMISNLKR